MGDAVAAGVVMVLKFAWVAYRIFDGELGAG